MRARADTTGRHPHGGGVAMSLCVRRARDKANVHARTAHVCYNFGFVAAKQIASKLLEITNVSQKLLRMNMNRYPMFTVIYVCLTKVQAADIK